MALIRSTVLASISGSIAGATFSRNAAGAYMRNRTKPVNPNSPNQILARGGLTSAATTWRDLSDLQQLGWKTYAQNTPRLNRIGETIHLSGIGEYMRLNAFLAFLGQPLHSDAPLLYGAPSPVTAITPVLSAATNDLTITTREGGSVDADAIYGVWVSNPVSTGVSFYKGPWTFLGSTAGDEIDGSVYPIPYLMAAGQVVFVRIRYMDESFRLSNEFIFGTFTVAA